MSCGRGRPRAAPAESLCAKAAASSADLPLPRLAEAEALWQRALRCSCSSSALLAAVEGAEPAAAAAAAAAAVPLQALPEALSTGTLLFQFHCQLLPVPLCLARAALKPRLHRGPARAA